MAHLFNSSSIPGTHTLHYRTLDSHRPLQFPDLTIYPRCFAATLRLSSNKFITSVCCAKRA